MKVYTKKGDQGQTSLLGGTRVSKSHLRIESYGTVDELNSYLGLVRDHLTDDKETVDRIISVQDHLFTMGSQLANDPEHSNFKAPSLEQSDIDLLEKWIDDMDEELEPMRNFILPGGNIAVSHSHIARCICRRAERSVVRLAEVSEVEAINISYLNRLSDYLFVLCRKIAKENSAKEIPWKPRQ